MGKGMIEIDQLGTTDLYNKKFDETISYGRPKIIAKKEDLMRVSCNSNHQLAILSWHIGNRHLNAEIKNNSIFLYRDTVISEMLRGLNAKVENVLEKFHPLEGAYSHSKHNH